MNMNATLIGQLIAFAIFAWFCMKYVWPPMITALEERKRTIADGLAAAEKGAEAANEAQAQAEQMVKEAKAQAADIISHARKQSNEIVEKAKTDASTERDRIVQSGSAEVAQMVTKAKGELQNQVGALAMDGAKQVLGREVDAKTHADLLDKLAADL